MALPLSRRRFLTLAGGAALLSGCSSSPLSAGLAGRDPNAGKLTYWNLCGGGDGKNMEKMETAFQASHRTVPLESTVLAWGNPYYTKLSLATTSGTPPDVGIAQVTRLPLLARAGQLTDLRAAGAGSVGITKDSFTPAAWGKTTVDGTNVAVPLDTHPFVLFYNTDLAKKAGLLGPDGALKPIHGTQEFVSALQAMQKVTGQYGGIVNISSSSTASSWRWFATNYYGLGGKVVGDNGTKLLLDDDKAAKALEFMGSLTGKGLFPKTADDAAVASIFASGKAGFVLEGVWNIPTYKTAGVKFGVAPVPALLADQPVSYADSHALVIPHNPNRSAESTRNAMTFIRALLDESLTWAKGGHVPAWLPVQKSPDVEKLQASYNAAAYDAQYDPDAWYSGAGSDFQILMGSAIGGVQNGSTDASTAIRSMRDRLTRYTQTAPPVA